MATKVRVIRAVHGQAILGALMSLLAGCGSPPDAGVSQDPALYREYEWPADWLPAFDDEGAELHGAFVAYRDGDRQIVVADSASALFGHVGKLQRSVVVMASHCGRNTAQLLVATRPLGAIGHDAGIGLHAAGIQCANLGDDIELPMATVSADTAYIGVGMSLWSTGRISAANGTAAAMGIRVGMSTQEAASIMLAKGSTAP